MYRNTGRVNLCETRVCEISTLLPALYSCRTITVHSVRRKEICISITTCSDNHCVCTEALELSGNEVTGDDTLSLTVNHYEVEHLVTRVALNGTRCYLTVKGRISAEQKLLTGLAPSIECTTYLYATE